MMKSAFIFCLIVLVGGVVSPARGDEIIVGQGTQEKVTVGDFDCSGCPAQVTNSLAVLMGNSSGEVTAGELWKFFARQGITSVDQLTICLDVAPSSTRSPYGLSGVELKIEDPGHFGQLITNVNFGGNSLLVPEYEISAFKPEARLQVALGYDFMKRFSADSHEKVSLGFASLDPSAAAEFSVEGNSALIPERFNFALLFGFIAFWVMVFVLLSRVTRSQLEPITTQLTAPKTSSSRALSA